MAFDPRPIGVFDSGVGGLSVVRAIVEAMPFESIVYLGDTARLPYGTKSRETVIRYARRAARVLAERDVKMVVVACNTASAVALGALSDLLAPVPVVGVVEPGARAAVATGARRILVLATEGTVRGGAYERAIARIRPEASVASVACPLFVGLAEEGWTDGQVPRLVAEAYVAPHRTPPPEAVVLGCTHFPLLADAIAEACGSKAVLVDSAATTAAQVKARLRAREAEAPIGPPGRIELFATDGVDRFARVGGRFLGRPIDPTDVQLVNLP